MGRYVEQKSISYDVVAGFPILYVSEYHTWRGSLYRVKTLYERSLKISYIQGLLYNQTILNSHLHNFIINIVPVGIKFQTTFKYVIPYFYIGAGVGIMGERIGYLKDDEIIKDKMELDPILTINLGGGAKVKVRNIFILSEMTYSVMTLFINAGIEFNIHKH